MPQDVNMQWTATESMPLLTDEQKLNCVNVCQDLQERNAHSSLCDFFFSLKLKLALKRKLNYIIMLEEQSQAEFTGFKTHTSANVSNSGAIAGLSASNCKGRACKYSCPGEKNIIQKLLYHTTYKQIVNLSRIHE
jgi:hypothetical protein